MQRHGLVIFAQVAHHQAHLAEECGDAVCIVDLPVQRQAFFVVGACFGILFVVEVDVAQVAQEDGGEVGVSFAAEDCQALAIAGCRLFPVAPVLAHRCQ